MNTAEFLDISAMVLPDRPALICEGRTRTYAETAAEVTRLATALQGLGVQRGDHVGIMSVNSAEYVIAYYACAKLGATYVPLNYRAKQEELAYMVNTAEVKVLFISDRYHDLVSAIQPSLKTVQHYVSLGTPQAGQIGYAALLARGNDDPPYVEIDDNDASIIIYTSGTTAMPKGVVITFQGLTVYVTNTMTPADPEAEHETTLVSVPLFHIAGATAMVSAMWGGRTLVILPQFSPEIWMHSVDAYKVSHSMVVPTMLKRIMDHGDFSHFDGSSLKLIAYGAAPMPYEVVRRAIDVFACGLMNAYGQTESTSSISFLGPDDHVLTGTPDQIALKERRLRSVGKIMDDIDLAIMDPSGASLKSGDEGEICIRSARGMAGYYKQEDATASAIQAGWLHTGDVGYVDGDGYLFITGRTKDLIIRGGENIAPGEIEDVLEQHPDIDEAAVIGVDDVEWGEVVKAVVVPRAHAKPLTLDVLRDYCKGRLASYKAPQYLAVVGELPRNHMGKVLKNDLRKLHGKPENEY